MMPQSPPGSNPPPIAYTKQAAADAIGLSHRTLDRLVLAGELPAFHHGRRRLFLRTELEAWAQRKQRAADERLAARHAKNVSAWERRAAS